MAQFAPIWWVICYYLYFYIVMGYVTIKKRWSSRQKREAQYCQQSYSEPEIIIAETQTIIPEVQQEILVKGFQYKKNQNHVSLCKQFDEDILVLTENKIIITNKINNEMISYESHYDKCGSFQIKKTQVTYDDNGKEQIKEFRGLSNQLKETSENTQDDEPFQNPQAIVLEKTSSKPKIQILTMTNMKTNNVSKYEPPSRPGCVIIDIPEEAWVKYNQTITRSLVERCEGQQWLSNEIINVFTRYINKQNSSQFWACRQYPDNNESLQRVYAFDVDTMGLLQAYIYTNNQEMRGYQLLNQSFLEQGLCGLWQRVLALGKYIFDIYEILFFPINKNNIHWFLISAKIVQGEFQFEVYDSIRYDESAYRIYFDMITKFLRTFGLIEDHQKCTLSVNGQCAQQSNGYDCGVYVCKFIQSLTYQKNVQNIQQKEINQMRCFLKLLLSKNQDQ